MAQAFERIYPELAAKYGVLLYPFFLDGVAADLKLTQPDGLHPNAAGVGVIVERILPKRGGASPRVPAPATRHKVAIVRVATVRDLPHAAACCDSPGTSRRLRLDHAPFVHRS